MPVLIKEPVTVDTSQNYEKPDIEIIEEKMIVTKSQQHSNSGSTLTVIDTKDDKEVPRTQYTVHKGPILDIKIFENSFLAASEDGRVYRYNQASNGILNIYKGHKAAVTCLYVYNANSTDINKEWMFSGSLDGTLRCYNIMTGVQARETADIGSPIQCMDEAWGIIFIGTKSGHVSRYHMKVCIIKGNSIQFSDKSVLALKATNEGPRRVLIVASRSQPITIRDAQSGLFLRTICGQKNHTVYSLMRDHNLIYCGTSSTSIPVFDFTNGEQTMQYDAGVGIVCMRLYRQLLFAGCYDGNIYVFDTKDHRLVCSIPGPGNMLLSMEVIDNKIIAGSKDKRLQSWQMPRQVRTLL
ncbi:Zinc finger protein 106 [Habropoda laboriosa]|uniref:Zinc finger protein 106 n=1 Tax=Habropoda laboriosa TaxID=597456 RepID=A0A0L7R1J2_9HYME|nr:Zinc finger protein 106 [Habropoda laboriosa]